MDSILKRYGNAFSLQEQAKLGCLPEHLTFRQIAELWANGDKEEEGILCSCISKAARIGDIRYHCPDSHRQRSTNSHVGRFLESLAFPHYATIHRDDFKAWLMQSDAWPIPTGNPLTSWFQEVAAKTAKKPGSYSERNSEAWGEVFLLRDKKMNEGYTLEEISDSPEIPGIFLKHGIDKCPEVSTIRKNIRGPGVPGRPKNNPET